MIRIVIPFHKNYDTIENLLLSIKDQDYEDHHVIIVIDGKDEKAEEAITRCSDIIVFETVIIENNEGAPNARNTGARQKYQDARDNYGFLFFIDADCRLYAGVLREFATQFELNPSVDFLYGNYRFENRQEFYSQPFDAYLLETMNYICTMSPMRRRAFEAVDGFRDLPYFQDWDLFYRMAKNGSTGKFIREFIFETKVSDENNISGTKGLTLSEKCEAFRKWNSITHKELAVTTHSAPLQAIQRAKMLNADYVGPALNGRRQVFPINYQFPWKATYMVGMFSSRDDATKDPFAGLKSHMAVMMGKPIYHFIGTDVFRLITQHTVTELRAIREALKVNNAKLFANSPRLVEELTECGIEAELLYTPIFEMEKYKPSELPSRFTVGVYYSDVSPMMHRNGAGGLSNIPLVEDVARSMPDISFKFFGGAARGDDKNIEMCGYIEDMSKFVSSCSMIVRSTIHDGYPQLPIQFMLSGRQALVSCPDDMPLTTKLSFEDVVDYDACKSEMIDKIYAMCKTPDPIKLSKDAHEHYSKIMSEEVFRKRIYEAVNE